MWKAEVFGFSCDKPLFHPVTQCRTIVEPGGNVRLFNVNEVGEINANENGSSTIGMIRSLVECAHSRISDIALYSPCGVESRAGYLFVFTETTLSWLSALTP